MAGEVKKNKVVPLAAEACRWRCDPQKLGFSSTEEVTADERILGQDEAVEALEFGLRNRFKGDNIFVRGLSGYGRMSLINETINQIAPNNLEVPDYLYVHNFEESDKPNLISLPPGLGKEFRNAMDDFSDFAQSELPAYLSSDVVQSKRKELIESTQRKLQELGQPLDQRLRDAGLTLVPMQVGHNVVPMILPVINGNPVTFEEIQKQRLEGRLSEEEFQHLTRRIGGFEKELAELGEQITAVQIKQEQDLRQLFADEARHYVVNRINAVKSRFDFPEVEEYLEQVLNDLINQRLLNDAGDFSRLYRVNLVSTHVVGERPPVVSVTNPTLLNLVGSIDTEFVSGAGFSRTDHLMIKPGALLQANGGFLVVDAREIISEPGAWSILLRTLKTGMFELTQLDPFGVLFSHRLKPEPIPVDIKVILVGDPETHYILDQYEPRFATQFKILADFSDTFGRDDEGFRTYANMLARLAKRDDLNHFRSDAVAMLIEHGARICAQKNRLTSKLGRIADIAREASFLSREKNRTLVEADDVVLSINKGRQRGDLPSRRFRRLITEGSVRIETSGSKIGQINGLAVTSAGPQIYGFPMRVTATVGPGNAGMINIERESELSGAIHTKGFMILSGLLRHVLRLDHPMAFSASIAFEQSYGGIDGDSASVAEFCALLSALTGLPLRQDLAVTSAVDQKGNILPVGSVTEKVEGFFDVCNNRASEGSTGVVIPCGNSEELMLRMDVVDAIVEERFKVYCVETIQQAVELFTGMEFGDLDDPAEGSVLHIARSKAHDFWLSARKKD